MLKDSLREMRKSVDGVISVCVSGADGIPVEVDEEDGQFISAEVVSAEMTRVIKSIGEFLSSTEGGKPEELVLRTEKYFIVLRVINPEYYIFTILSSDGNLGKVRYLLRRLSERLKKEL